MGLNFDIDSEYDFRISKQWRYLVLGREGRSWDGMGMWRDNGKHYSMSFSLSNLKSPDDFIKI